MGDFIPHTPCSTWGIPSPIPPVPRWFLVWIQKYIFYCRNHIFINWERRGVWGNLLVPPHIFINWERRGYGGTFRFPTYFYYMGSRRGTGGMGDEIPQVERRGYGGTFRFPLPQGFPQGFRKNSLTL